MRLKINPVLQREIKVKMRGWRSPLTISVYLCILILFAGLVMFNINRDIYSPVLNTTRFMSIYSNLSILQFVLIMFIAPALTSGAISGEREKQTLDLLLSTKMSPFSIIIGKLMASISHILLLIIASLPVFSIVFLFGGISEIEILQLFGYYIITAVTFGAIGIFFSTLFKKTAVSNALSYGTIGILCIGTLVIFIMTMAFGIFSYQTGGVMKTPFLLYTNPLAGFSSIVSEHLGAAGGYGYYGYRGFSIFSFISSFSIAYGAPVKKGMEIWKGNIIFNLSLTVILILLSSIKLNPVKRNIYYGFKNIFFKIKSMGKHKEKSQDVI